MKKWFRTLLSRIFRRRGWYNVGKPVTFTVPPGRHTIMVKGDSKKGIKSVTIKEIE